MARPLRIEYPGAWYHVMNRGLGRQWIFKSDHQRRFFLSLLSETAKRYNADWHAYCLMDNHYHLMLHTPDGNLQRIMRHVNGLYTQYFNRTQRRDGPLFRGRYKAVLVDAQAHWLTLSRYIHRNPLEAGVVTQLKDYPWSSYPAYCGEPGAPDWLTMHYVLRSLGQRDLKRRYMKYVTEEVDDEVRRFYARSRHGVILGDDTFRTDLLKNRPALVDVPELKMERPVPGKGAIIEAVCRRFQVDETVIWRKTRGRGSVSPARGVAMYVCQIAGRMTLVEIAEAFGLASYASAGSSIRHVRQRIENEADLREKFDYILLDLTP